MINRFKICFYFLLSLNLISFFVGNSVNPIFIKSNAEIQKENQDSEKINPSDNYKLIGIYIVDGEPLALIEDQSNLDIGQREYKIGDFLDEMQTISISKISLSPTSRVELIDNDGLSYLMKPSAAEVSTGSKHVSTSYPTYSGDKKSYSYKKKYKSKPKNQPSDQTETPSQPASNPPPQDTTAMTEPPPNNVDSSAVNPTPPPPQENTASTTINPPPDASSQAQPPPNSENPPPSNQTTSTQDSNSAPAQNNQPSDTYDGLGRDRPGNAFN